jgi:thiol-disulfide isomerase/thioredoxin
MALTRPRVRAPEFGRGEWLNTTHPLRMAELRGRAVVVHIWDFTCINCLRTLPYLTAWHRTWRKLGVAFIGVHTPEFAFARDSRQVAAAISRYGIEYPVLLDNDQHTWDAFANRYWPTIYLINADGYIVYQHAGEGAYTETEAALAELVRQATGGQPPAEMPRPLGILRPEDQSGAACFRTTPELHTGYHLGALGNPEGYLPRSLPALYRLPLAAERQDGWFYVEGTWQAGEDYLALAGDHGSLVLPYRGATANAVLSVSADPVELMLDLKPPIEVHITQDGQPLDTLSAGADVSCTAGHSTVRVDAPRLYELTKNLDGRQHELRIDIPARGLAVFAFTFSTCVVPSQT